jgi:DNA replication protein DnaC
LNYIEKKDKCGNVYVIVDPKHKERSAQKKYNYRLKKSGIPEKYWDFTLDDYKGINSIISKNKVTKYCENIKSEKFQHVHLYLSGGHNTQKTTMAGIIGKEFIKLGKDVMFVRGSKFTNALLKVQGYNNDENINQFLDECRFCDLLIIDDIFNEESSISFKNSKADSSSVNDFFQSQIEMGIQRIVLTSNIPMNSIQNINKSMFNHMDVNFQELKFNDSVHDSYKNRFENLWED